MARDWNEFDKFEALICKYMPSRGEGETMASQICTAVNKLVYKWYNDGDVYDNTYMLQGWANDLSSYANWLYAYASVGWILEGIRGCVNDGNYEDLLYVLCESAIRKDLLETMDEQKKIGTIYECDGPFKYEEPNDNADW